MTSLLSAPSVDTTSASSENSNNKEDGLKKNNKVKDLKIKKNTATLGTSNIIHCLSCSAIGKTIFYTADIPSFGYTDIVSFSCEKCGYRYSKTSSNNNNDEKEDISAFGMKTTLIISDMLDLQRSVIIQDEAIISIPELDIQVRPISGGKITTVEGAISSLCKEVNSLNIIGAESKAEDENHEKLQMNIVTQLKELLSQFDGGKNNIKSNSFTFCLIE
jgi:C4-type Zn-finger protein